ncbi:YdhK family protein [Planococcus sp. ISL-110]|uniref:YdhK family protein n=1 Tax=Planococcus sp. ISL-110 TaxID=2819167 RepID=UPI001BE688FC|nr:YdhK family protein [Planococcus sp. ISL-110]MBT2569782.1 YdhK family protein [Planococcus sp. ISL-110]
MTKNKFMLMTMSVLTAITLAACGDTEEDSMNPADPDNQVDMTEEMDEAMDEDADEMDEDMGHEGMEHSSSGEVPEGLAEAENPKFEVGSKVIMNADHMPGMDGAEATVVGAYDTTVYSLSFTPTTGGEPIENHKWVIHEELEEAGATPLSVGDEIIIAEDHMEGMRGATSIIDSVEETTVYMVDFNTTDSNEAVTNHKWVTESELSAE